MTLTRLATTDYSSETRKRHTVRDEISTILLLYYFGWFTTRAVKSVIFAPDRYDRHLEYNVIMVPIY